MVSIVGLTLVAVSSVAAVVLGILRVLLLYFRGAFRDGLTPSELSKLIAREMKPFWAIGAAFLAGLGLILVGSL